MKNKTKVLASSLTALVMAGGVTVGATYALFTSEAKTNIAVTAGKVNATATIGDIAIYSADATMTEGVVVEGGEDLPQYAHKYYYNDRTAAGTWLAGGAASVTGNTLTLDRMVPGDRADAYMYVTNNSNVDVKYRLVAECVDTDEQSLKLFSKLKFTAFGVSKTNVRKYATAWELWKIPTTEEQKVERLGITVEMPLALQDEFQATQAHVALSVEMVQANAYTTDAADEILVFKSEEVPAKAGDPTKMDDVTLKAGGTEAQPLVKVEVPTGTENQVKAGSDYVELGDTLSLSVVEDETVPSIVIEADQSSKNYDITLKNQDDKVITTVDKTLKVSVYVGEGKEIVGVYHKGNPVPAFDGTNEGYVYENGYIVYHTSSFSPFTVIFQEYFKGAGTEANPYVISSIGALKAVSTKIGDDTVYFKVDTDLTATQEDVSSFIDYWGDPVDAVLGNVKNMVMDFDGHKIDAEIDESTIFGDVRNSTIKNLDVDITGDDCGIVYYSENIVLDNVNADGTIKWSSGNYGIYVGYLIGDVTLNNCVCKTDVSSITGGASMYNAVFFGYGMDTGTASLTNCSYEGSFVSGKAGLIMANWSYGTNLSFVLKNVKNNGLVKSTCSVYYGGEGAYNYLTADYWDKAAKINFTIDDGPKMTAETSPKWYEIAGQGGVVGTGTFVAGSDDATLALTMNADKTFTITPSSKEGVTYYKVSVGTYVGTQYGSSRVYATEKITTGLVTTIKYLQFVDAEWVTANPTAVKGDLAGNVIYTLEGETYYLASEGSVGVVPRNPEMISVSAFNANDVLVSSFSLVYPY